MKSNIGGAWLFGKVFVSIFIPGNYEIGGFFHFLFIFTQTVTSWPVFLFKTQYRDASDNFISDVQYFLKSDLYFIEICTAVVKKGIQPQTREYDVNIYPTNFIPDYDF